MTPNFALAVDPIFLHVLRLVERLDAGETLAPAEVKRGIETPLHQADTLLRNGKDWALAKYALVVWIDDVLINSRWDHNQEWADNYLLEVDLYESREAYDKFYIEAETAKKLPTSDALEVFYVCVVLGFRGMYRDPLDAERRAPILGLPTTLDAWTQQTAQAIRAGKGMPSIVGNPRAGAGVPALRGYSSLCWTSLIAALATLVLTFLILILWPDSKG